MIRKADMAAYKAGKPVKAMVRRSDMKKAPMIAPSKRAMRTMA